MWLKPRAICWIGFPCSRTSPRSLFKILNPAGPAQDSIARFITSLDLPVAQTWLPPSFVNRVKAANVISPARSRRIGNDLKACRRAQGDGASAKLTFSGIAQTPPQK
jgi:hypothetical protein